MLIYSLFLSALAVHPLIKPTVALPASVYREDGSVEIQFNHSIKEGSIVPKSVALLEFKGCTPDMKDALTTAWINMVGMGSKIKGNIEFNEAVAVDFFGEPSKNGEYQNRIRGMIEGVADSSPDGSSPEIRVVCDGMPTDDAKGDFCLPGVAQEDFNKCNSRCWLPVRLEGRITYRASGVDAFTRRRGGAPPTMGFCPNWFDVRKPCFDKYVQWKDSPNARRDLTNYACREQSMVHELFHVDAHWEKYAPGNGHVKDIKFTVKKHTGNNFYQNVERKAYGPYYTKVLARLDKFAKGGKHVATNADNLAYYFLAKWLELQGHYRVDLPDIGRDRPFEVTDPIIPKIKRQEPSDQPQFQEPIDEGSTPDVWDPLKIANGEVTLGDLDDLAQVLQVDSKEAARLFADPGVVPCTDLIETEDGQQICEDEDSEIVELDGSTDVLPNAQLGDGGLPIGDPTEYTTSPGSDNLPQPTQPPSPPPPPPPPQGPDTNSPAYAACGNKLGASSCPGSDKQCIIDQCKNDSDCQASRFDCSVFG